MKNINNKSGFTLIELILVIAILGILAVAVAPQFVNIQASAHGAQAAGVAGAVRDGINMYYARELATTGIEAYPAALETVAASCAGPGNCFDAVLKNYPTSGWTEAADVYTHTGSTCQFTYDAVAGTFALTNVGNGYCD